MTSFLIFSLLSLPFMAMAGQKAHVFSNAKYVNQEEPEKKEPVKKNEIPQKKEKPIDKEVYQRPMPELIRSEIKEEKKAKVRIINDYDDYQVRRRPSPKKVSRPEIPIGDVEFFDDKEIPLNEEITKQETTHWEDASDKFRRKKAKRYMIDDVIIENKTPLLDDDTANIVKESYGDLNEIENREIQDLSDPVLNENVPIDESEVNPVISAPTKKEALRRPAPDPVEVHFSGRYVNTRFNVQSPDASTRVSVSSNTGFLGGLKVTNNLLPWFELYLRGRYLNMTFKSSNQKYKSSSLGEYGAYVGGKLTMANDLALSAEGGFEERAILVGVVNKYMSFEKNLVPALNLGAEMPIYKMKKYSLLARAQGSYFHSKEEDNKLVSSGLGYELQLNLEKWGESVNLEVGPYFKYISQDTSEARQSIRYFGLMVTAYGGF